MIKVGNKVNPFHNLTLTGVVIEIKEVKTKHMTASGVPGKSYEYYVRLDKDGSVVKFSPGQLMRIDE